MNLISLIARRPKNVDSLDDMIEAIKLLAESGGAEEKDKTIRINVEQLKNFMMNNGEKMQEVEVEEILADCSDLIHEDYMIIDDFGNYLMSR